MLVRPKVCMSPGSSLSLAPSPLSMTTKQVFFCNKVELGDKHWHNYGYTAPWGKKYSCAPVIKVAEFEVKNRCKNVMHWSHFILF